MPPPKKAEFRSARFDQATHTPEPGQALQAPGGQQASEVEAALLEVLGKLPDAILCFDREWHITFANLESRRIARLGDGELPSKTYWELFPETVGTELENRYRQAMKSGEQDRLEYFYAPFDISVEIELIPISSGLALRFRDISSRVRAAEAGAAVSRQLEQVYAAAPDCILVIDQNWNFTFANEQAVGFLRAGSLIGRNLFELFPGNREEPYLSNYERAMVERIPTEFEAFYGTPLNTWFRVLARPFDPSSIILFFNDIGPRRTAEHARDEATAQLLQVLSVTSDGIFTLDRDWRFVYINRQGEQILAPAGEVQGKNLFELFPAIRGSVLARNYAVTMEQRVATRSEIYYPEPLNSWFDAEAVPSPQGLTVFFRNITARKRNEEALIASEARYRVLSELNPQILWVSSAEGRITYANQRFLEFIGIEVLPEHGAVWLSAIFAADRSRIVRHWQGSIASGTEFNEEVRLIRSGSDEPRWFSVRSLPVRDEAGEILQWLGVATDIHTAKTAAEMLRRQQQATERERAELATVYKTAPIGLALFDPVEFRYLRLNDRQAGFFGLPVDAIVGKTLTEMAPIPGLYELFQQVAAGTPVANFLLEGELISRPGEHRYWTVNYFPVYDADGEVQAISAASLEVTQQKRAEQALIQSEKLAAVGRLASSISHEINNPLEAVTNLLYLVSLHEELAEDVRVYIQMAQSELARVSQIATHTLRFHRQAVNPTWVTAAQLVDAVLNLYQGRLANSRIQVDARYQAATPLLCFENDIRQVLNNLIANAIDAMRSGGQLLARAHDAIDPVTQAKGVRITIADTGHGMSAETQRRIFEPFFTTKDLNGTGLGLWISFGIVQRHHGRITVRSSQDPVHHGTVFSLFLPVLAEDHPPIHDPVGAGGGARAADSSSRPGPDGADTAVERVP